ncbi:hypothetical protein C8J56DRAFT_1038500 [Mycena floridula]|nr:hypothetical protein C8J56DRAFT_1038500 [Mycena floridula]
MASRPKPRPRPAQAQRSSSNAPDDDSFFMRNTDRSTTTWANLEKINKVKKPANSEEDDDDDDDDGEASSPRPRKQKKKKANPPKAKPAWKATILTLSSDEEEKDAFQDIENTPRKTKRRKEDSKNRRSRSRSITPPPVLPADQLQRTAKVVRETLAANTHRSVSPDISFPGDEDASTDNVELDDPELARIIREAATSRKQSQMLSSQPTASTSGSDEQVILRVQWKPHPLNEYGEKSLQEYTMLRRENFRALYETVADSASILTDTLVLTHRGKLIFPGVTPQSLSLSGTVDFVACDRNTYEYVRARANIAPEVEPDEDPDVIEIVSDPEETPFEIHDESDTGAGGESEHEGETFKLILRSGMTSRDITLTVRPTTKCGAIVKAFLKKAGLPDKPNSPKKRKSVGGKGGSDPCLCIDGDKVDNDIEIGEMDLEDGDLVEVFTG